MSLDWHHVSAICIGALAVTLLSRKVDYAILILTYLVRRQGHRPSAREIADSLGLSRPFAAKRGMIVPSLQSDLANWF